MAAIEIQNVTKTFTLPHLTQRSLAKKLLAAITFRGQNTERQVALSDVTVTVEEGEFLGIVGRNGSGKSTLLKILAGIYQPNEGAAEVHGKIMPFIELGVGFNPELTGRENVFLSGALLGFSTKEMEKRLPEIIEFSELERFMDQKLKNYSSGMQVRLAFSIAIQAEADVLLIDEVLAVGDAAFQRKCFDYFRKLKKSDKTIVFVTHDMEAVREYCDRAIVIDNTKVVSSGDLEEAIAKYQEINQRIAKKEKGEVNRWGDGTVQIEKCATSKKSYDDSEKDIEVTYTIKAKQDVENVTAGISVTDQMGRHLLGTNNDILKKPIKSMKKGEKQTLTWSFPNIFNEGTLSLSCEVKTDAAIADTIIDAAEFTVFRDRSTGYVTVPPIKLKVSK